MKRDPIVNHKVMASIKGKDTKIELALREQLKKENIYYFKNYKKLIGKPDIYIPSSNLAIFADSEFWHGYNFDIAKSSIKTNIPFWVNKIETNIARDKKVNETLLSQGVGVLRFYGFEIEKELPRVMENIISTHKERKQIIDRIKAIKQKTTLGYIKIDDKYLFLYRNKKKNDPNEGKYVGIGGHFENDENRYSCLRREVKEETCLTIKKPKFLGTIYFLNDTYEDEMMFLFEIDSFEGKLSSSCNEGELKLVKKEDILDLPLWEGDKVFLPLLGKEEKRPFELTLIYKKDRLEKVIGPFYK